MTGADDAPLTDAEIERLLALCEADAAPLQASTQHEHWIEAQARTEDFANAARTALPRALREVLRLRAELDGVAAFLATYGKTKDDVLGAMKWLVTEQDAARVEISQSRAEVERLHRALDAVREQAASIAEGQEYYPDTYTGTRQQWVKDQIAAKIRALDAAGVVLGSDG